MKLRYLLLLPLLLLVIAGGTLLALPGFIAAPNHRPSMERFASALTGREVHIKGPLALTLLPQPRLTASQITIAGPDHEVISAKSLALDIALAPLLQGQLAVKTLNLDAPVIALPWPLPGGPSSVAPPAWLAALHAHLTNAAIRVGQLAFTNVGADLFTGPEGAVSISGNGQLAGQSVTLSLALGQLGLDGAAPLSADASAGKFHAKFSGTLDAQSQINGQLTATLPDGTTGTATLNADGKQIALAQLKLQHGSETLSGSASYNLTEPALQAELLGQNLTLDSARLSSLTGWAANLPASVTLDSNGLSLFGQSFPSFSVKFTTGPSGTTVRNLTLSLPGGGSLYGNGALTAGGALSGALSLSVPDSAPLLAAYHFPPLPGWPSAKLSATLAGTADQPLLQKLTGTLGPDHVTGTLVLGPRRAGGTLAFDHLLLTPLAGWAGQTLPGGFTAGLTLTAAKAEAGPVLLTNLAVEAELDGTLTIRRVSANLYGGLAAGSFTLDSSGRVTQAQGFIDLPSATPLAALIPASYAPPTALLTPRATLLLAARGPANALAASAVLHLGQFTLTASPLIDLTKHTAAGALSLQHPEAILIARLFGMDQGLQFPGAGSASLRAHFTAAPGAYGLDDFILSFGASTASGQLMVQNGSVSGGITAGTLALPPIPANAQLPASLPLQGKLSFAAQQLLYAGQPLARAVSGKLSWSGPGAEFDLADAALAGGNLSGSLGMALSTAKPPAFTAHLMAQNLDAAQLALPLPFPYPLTSGTLGLNASLTASGYGLKSIMATLAGTASLEASKGKLSGFNLAAFADALGTKDAAHGLYRAALGGTSSFDTLNLAGTIANGNCTLTSATLTGPAGKVTATGGIDLYDQAQALKLTLTPANINPPVNAELLVLGTWAKPKHIAHIKAALAWRPAAPPPAPAH